MDDADTTAAGPARTPGPEPDWLAAWRRAPVTPAQALARFETLPAIAPARMTGRWRGAGLPTGHPLDGLLEALGWYGKAFKPDGRAHPLLFRARSGGIVSLDPARMPLRLALRLPRLARGRLARHGFAALRPLLRARGPTARLETVRFRGAEGTAMVYDRQPITDHFRAIDRARLLGLMQVRGDPRPYAFLLTRDPPDRRGTASRPRKFT